MKFLRTGMLVATAVAIVWCGWILLNRYLERREWEQQQRKRAADPEAQERFNRTYGGSDLKILNFYSPGPAQTAGTARLLCFGVLNAKSVRIDPPVQDVYPTLSRCVETRPEKETRYTLTAEDAAGHSVSASLILSVKPAPRKASP